MQAVESLPTPAYQVHKDIRDTSGATSTSNTPNTNYGFPTSYTSMSSNRRKPKITYQSPSAHTVTDLRIEGSTSFSRALSLKLATSTSSSSMVTMTSSTNYLPHSIELKPVVKRKKYPMGPPLPLYHPLGRLALSLPELDPVNFGYPSSLAIDDTDSARRSSARARRPAPKLRDADDDAASIVVAVSDSAAIIVKERPSPRKRRNQTSSSSKRKRREVNDGDSAYPAKRASRNRGGVPRDVASPSESVPPPEPDTPAKAPREVSEERPERRTTRSRGAMVRGESSASETATSVSVSITAREKSSEMMDVDPSGIQHVDKNKEDEESSSSTQTKE